MPQPQEKSLDDDRLHRVNYRLSKSPEEIAAESEKDDRDYTPFVLGAANAALLLFLAQAVAAMFVADYLGATIQIRFVASVIPTLQFITDIPTFVEIITWSTAIAVVASCLGVFVALVRHRNDELRLYGWTAGLAMAGLLVIFQMVRHLANPPIINAWVIAQTTAFIIVTALVFIGFKPGARLPEPVDARPHADSVKASRLTRTKSARSEAEKRRVNTRNQKQEQRSVSS